MSTVDDDALAEAYERALQLEKSGDTDAAEAAWHQVLALDPEDHGGAAVRLAAIGRGQTPDKAPDAYVKTLFDQHAEVFDDILVEQLDYAVPMQLRQLLLERTQAAFAKALDLGCGTGLCGSAFGDIVGAMTGVDISENMIEMSDEREVYEHLYVCEALEFLQTAPSGDRWNLIIATDVLPYFGTVEPLFSSVRARLEPDGFFAFSTETLPTESLAGKNYCVGPGHRFTHDGDYLRQILLANRMEVVAYDMITVRLDEGQPVPGELYLVKAV